MLLVDDHTIFGQGLARLLGQEDDMEIVGQAGSGEEGVELAACLRPDVVLMDVTLPGISGIEATRKIVAELPGTRVIGLSVYHAADQADTMRHAGAVGYLSKDTDSQELLREIRAAREG